MVKFIYIEIFYYSSLQMLANKSAMVDWPLIDCFNSNDIAHFQINLEYIAGHEHCVMSL